MQEDRTYTRGDIYYTKIDRSENSVQGGFRPVIVIQNNIGNEHSPTVIVACITSKNKKYLPTHIPIGISGGLTRASTILCEQLFTIDKTHLQDYVGTISDPHILKELDKRLRVSLGIGENND